jgi:hypothetical protein
MECKFLKLIALGFLIVNEKKKRKFLPHTGKVEESETNSDFVLHTA